jgi:hypothetical protein
MGHFADDLITLDEARPEIDHGRRVSSASNSPSSLLFSLPPKSLRLPLFVTRGPKPCKLLEDGAVDILRRLDRFEVLDSRQWRRHARKGSLPEDYVVRQFPYPTRWAPRGRKEAFISTTYCSDDVRLERNADGTIHVIVEAKFQNGHGSADEKLVHVHEAFSSSNVRNWVVVYDGSHWSTLRGRAIIEHLKGLPVPAGRTFRVLNRNEFAEFAYAAWGVPLDAAGRRNNLRSI